MILLTWQVCCTIVPIGIAAWGRSRRLRMAPTVSGSVRKARMRMSAPQSGQGRGKTS